MKFKPLLKFVIIGILALIEVKVSGQATWNFTTAAASGTLPANITTLSSATQVNNNGTTTFIAAGAPASSTAFYAGASGGNNGNFSARTGVINTATSTYLQVVLTPAANNWVNISAIQWGNFSLSSTGPTTLSIYTSINNYTAPVATAAVGYSTTNWTLANPSFAPINGITGAAVTVRIYASGGTGTTPAAGAVNWRVDDLRITATGQSGTVGQIPKYSSNNTFANSNITDLNGNIGIGTTAPDSALTVNNGIWGKRGVRLSNLPVSNNVADSMVVVTTTGAGIGTLGLRKIPAGASGTVTSVAAGYGITGGTITAAGTHGVDTGLIATRAWRQKGIDSVQANINLLQTGINGKVNIADTAAMLLPYAGKDFLNAGTGINYSSVNGTITNTAPDQPVGLTAGTGIGVSGTYPNFTITNNSPATAGSFIQNSTALQSSSNFNISGNGTIGDKLKIGTNAATIERLYAETADNGNFTSSLYNSGGVGRVLKLNTGGPSGQTILDAQVAGSSTFRINAAGNTPDMGILDVNHTSNTAWVGVLKSKAAGFGKVLFLSTESVDPTTEILKTNYGATSSSLGINAFSVYANGNSYMSGNLGIGVNSPSALLHTNGSLRFQGLTNNNSLNRILVTDSLGNISWKDASSVSANSWGLTGNAGTLTSSFLGTSDNNSLRFRTNNLERMVLDSIGNLTANGDIKSKAVHLTQWGTWGSIRNLAPTNGFELVSNGIMVFRAANGARNAYLKPDGDFSLVGGSGEELAGIGTNNGSNNLIFKSNGAPGVFPVERMRLTAAGNFGIGTNNPLAQLHTNGTVRFDSYKNNAAGDSVLTTDVDGNLKLKALPNQVSSSWSIAGDNIYNNNLGSVGIGTNTPNTAYKLDVLGDIKSGRIIPIGNMGGIAIGQGTFASADGTTGTSIAIGTNAMGGAYSGTGNVAVGENALYGGGNSPQNSIAIGYNAGSTQIAGQNNIFIGANTQPSVSGGASDQLNIGNWIYGNNGKIGIGINSPIAQLHTNGSVRFDNYKNNAAGDSVLTTDENGNLKLKVITALPVGWGLAGNSGTNPATNFIGTTDNVDIVFKRNSIKSGLITADNVAFGTNSLLNNTTGVRNVALGLNALMSNTTGNYNNAIGALTLQANTNGFDNLASGYAALMSNTTGHTNVAAGSYSLLNNTTGISNTALGTQTLTANVSGNYNLASGRYALLQSTTGSDNVAAGLQSMYSNISGNNNVAMGNYSLFSNTSGSNNVSIGYRSNVGSNNLTNATAIGSQSYVTQSNSLVLGSIAGINGAPASTNVGIGVTSPSAKLHTNGSLRFEGLSNNNSLNRVLATDSLGNIFWKDASSVSVNSWGLAGNAGTNPATNFIGTADSTKLVVKTNGIQRLSVGADGTINFDANDTAARPAFRFYPNGDFTVKARRELTGNTLGNYNGLRFNSKYGIFEVGTDNNFDTTLAGNCCGSLAQSAIIVNSDFTNTFRGAVHGSVVSGDNMNMQGISWSSVIGESHSMTGAGFINKSFVGGYGQNIKDVVSRSIIVGESQQINYPFRSGYLSGYINTLADVSGYSNINGIYNTVGGIGQLVSGLGHTVKTPYGTNVGNKSVDFASLGYLGSGVKSYDSLEYAPNLDKYPIFAIGNSKYYVSGVNAAKKSNALTVLYNGRTQINTTGFNNNLTEADVTPKAALEVVSTNSGVLLPKLSNAQRDSIAITDLHNGLLLYNTDSSIFQYYNGTVWRSVGANSESASTNNWGLTGNAGTTASNFLGTTDNMALNLKTNNVQRMIIDTSGNVGIGTINPGYKLDVNGSIRSANRLYIGSSPDNYAPGNLNVSSFAAKDTFVNSVLTLSSTETGASSVYPTQLVFGQEGADVGWSIQPVNQGISYSNLLLNKNGGNVGIGTLSPSAQLHTTGTVRFGNYSNNPAMDSVLTTDSIGNLKLVKLNIPSAIDNSKWVLTNSTIHNVDSLNVGIGTDSALAKLHINGNILLETYRNNPQLDSVLTTDDEGKLIMAYRPFGGGGGGTVYNFLNGVQQLNGNVSFGGILQDSVKLNTGNNSFAINNGTQKLFNIAANNNIGLGTAAPAARLDIQQLTAADLAYDAIRIYKPVDSVKSWISFAQGTGAGTTAFRLGQISQFSGLGLYKGSNNPAAPGQLVQKWDINGNTGINTSETTGELSVGSVHGNKLSIGNSQWAQPHIINTGTHNTYGDYTDIKVAGSLFNNAFIRLNKSGNVGIGTANIDSVYRLSVNGKIRAKGLKVESGNWADFVFEPGYKLRSLSEVESFIKANKHLPEVPTSEQVKKDGTDVGEIQALLLQKIEELTLYIIDQDKKVKELEEKNKTLQTQAGEIDNIKKQIEEIKKLVVAKN